MENSTKAGLTRREILGMALTAPLLRLITKGTRAQGRKLKTLDRQSLVNAPGLVVPSDASSGVKQVELVRKWDGSLCRSKLINHGRQPVRIKEVVLFDLKLPLPPETRLYGE